MNFIINNLEKWKEASLEANLVVPENLPFLRFVLTHHLYAKDGGQFFDDRYSALSKPSAIETPTGCIEIDLGINKVIEVEVDCLSAKNNPEEILATKKFEPKSIDESIARLKALSFFASAFFAPIGKMLLKNYFTYAYIPMRLHKDDGYEFCAYIDSGFSLRLVKFNRVPIVEESILKDEIYFYMDPSRSSSFETLTSQKWYAEAFLNDPEKFVAFDYDEELSKI